MKRVGLCCVALLGGCRAAPGARAGSGPEHAELLLRGGVVLTLDPRRPTASAVAVRGGHIMAAGGDAETGALVGPGTRVVELAGRTVLASLTDAHAHLYGLGRSLAQADLRGCASAAECAARAREWTSRDDEAAPQGWVLGRGWDQSLFPDRRFPSRAALDQALPDRPAWLRRVDGHAGWANSRALAAAGVTRATPDPPGGRILRDGSGEPTGLLVDAAMALVDRVVPEPPAAARRRAILRAQEEALRHGITAVHEMGIDEETAAAFRALERDGQLLVRVYAFAAGAGDDTLDRLLARAPDPARRDARFTLRGIKLFADGALGSRGAALLADYADDPGNRGLIVTPGAAIESAARRALEQGWQLTVHAIGDRANREVLDAYGRAGCDARRDHRFRIEHAQVVALDDIPRFRSLGVIASMQPAHATSDMAWAEARLGRERLAGAYAWRRFLDAGVRVAGGSDFPVEAVDLVGGGLYAAVTRSDSSGRPEGGWLPEQRLELVEAIRLFTADAAFAAFEDEWRGRAAAGMAADLTVLDRDLLAAPPRALVEARVDMTIVGGRVVYERR